MMMTERFESSLRFNSEIDRHTRGIDDQRNRRRRRNELPFVDLEAEHRGRSDAALIADEASKETG